MQDFKEQKHLAYFPLVFQILCEWKSVYRYLLYVSFPSVLPSFCYGLSSQLLCTLCCGARLHPGIWGKNGSFLLFWISHFCRFPWEGVGWLHHSKYWSDHSRVSTLGSPALRCFGTCTHLLHLLSSFIRNVLTLNLCNFSYFIAQDNDHERTSNFFTICKYMVTAKKVTEQKDKQRETKCCL